ncbi:MAG TPA: glycosyltransferase family 4 protein [Polyangiaceae bacterium]|nr:glycosyltransferase family 4 protein [Polyangiaceae bacterium]
MAANRPHLPLVFVHPQGIDAPSGGNVYDRELTRALAELVPVTIMPFSEAKGALDGGRAGAFFFDTLELELTRSLGSTTPDQLLGLIVHHLPSLEPHVAFGSTALERENATLSRFDRLVATSDFTRELLVSRGLSERAILTVPPALPNIANAPRAYRAPLSVLLVANVIPRKGVLDLLEALAANAPPSMRFSLHIAGRLDMDPDYVARCQRVLASSASLRESVHLDGPISYERMGTLYDEAHLLVSASAMETFGMAIHEARAHGLPVLALDAGYVRAHFAHGENGLLCSSSPELATALVELARDDDRMAALFSRAQAKNPSGYSWPDAAQRFVAELARTGD